MKLRPGRYFCYCLWQKLIAWILLTLFTGNVLGNRLVTTTEESPTYLLIHGGFHGAWCWYKVRPLLEQHHCRVITPDLSGSGKEHGDFVRLLGNLLAQQSQPVILVGHSSGGMVITALAKQYPQKVRAVVYLAAFLLPEGQSPPDVMEHDKASLLIKALETDSITHRVRVNPSMAKQVFYGDCPDSVADWAIARLTTEPQVPSSSASKSTATHQSVFVKNPPRFYIETRLDKALSLASQREMYSRLPCQKVYSMPTSHSPFLSRPSELTDILLDIHQQVP